MYDASLLYEVPHQKGNEGCQEHNYEEWEASYSGCVPDMQHQDVQNREGLKLAIIRYQEGPTALSRCLPTVLSPSS